MLSHPGLGPDPDRAFVEARIMDIVLAMAAGGQSVFYKEIWKFLAQCGKRGLLDLSSENSNVAPVAQVLTVSVPYDVGPNPRDRTALDDAGSSWTDLTGNAPKKQMMLARFMQETVRAKGKEKKPDVVFDFLTTRPTGADRPAWVDKMIQWHQNNAEKSLNLTAPAPSAAANQTQNTPGSSSPTTNDTGRSLRPARNKGNPRASEGDAALLTDKGGHNLRDRKKKRAASSVASDGSASNKKQRVIDVEDYLESLPEKDAPSPWEHLQHPVCPIPSSGSNLTRLL